MVGLVTLSHRRPKPSSSLVVTDLGSEVVMDLPLGKLVCNLRVHENGGEDEGRA